MCIVCQTAPLLAAGGGGAGMIWHRARVALGRCGAYDDHAAWAAWAEGRPPWEDEAAQPGRGRSAAVSEVRRAAIVRSS